MATSVSTSPATSSPRFWPDPSNNKPQELKQFNQNTGCKKSTTIACEIVFGSLLVAGAVFLTFQFAHLDVYTLAAIGGAGAAAVLVIAAVSAFFWKTKAREDLNLPDFFYYIRPQHFVFSDEKDYINSELGYHHPDFETAYNDLKKNYFDYFGSQDPGLLEFDDSAKVVKIKCSIDRLNEYQKGETKPFVFSTTASGLLFGVKCRPKPTLTALVDKGHINQTTLQKMKCLCPASSELPKLIISAASIREAYIIASNHRIFIEPTYGEQDEGEIRIQLDKQREVVRKKLDYFRLRIYYFFHGESTLESLIQESAISSKKKEKIRRHLPLEMNPSYDLADYTPAAQWLIHLNNSELLELFTPVEVDGKKLVALREKIPNVNGHGVKSGRVNFINILFEGGLWSNSWSAHFWTSGLQPQASCGFHGPYYVLLTETTDAYKDPFAFVVPDENEKKRIIGSLENAVKLKIITIQHYKKLLPKIITYDDLLNIDDPSALQDSENLKAYLENQFEKN
jgi:hypothetical protein